MANSFCFAEPIKDVLYLLQEWWLDVPRGKAWLKEKSPSVLGKPSRGSRIWNRESVQHQPTGL
jgi:hypothetical protein